MTSEARQPVAHNDTLNGSGAPQIGDRLVEQHQRDRCDNDYELRKNTQLQLLDFNH
jgi:hypothetical protein